MELVKKIEAMGSTFGQVAKTVTIDMRVYKLRLNEVRKFCYCTYTGFCRNGVSNCIDVIFKSSISMIHCGHCVEFALQVDPARHLGLATCTA
jgi:hypothetical protein